jgi:hypothetical protein
LEVRALKLSKYIEHLQAFQAEHGDVEVFVRIRPPIFFRKDSLIGVKNPHTPVAADFYLVDGSKMILKPGKAIQKHNPGKFPVAGTMALLVEFAMSSSGG